MVLLTGWLAAASVCESLSVGEAKRRLMQPTAGAGRSATIRKCLKQVLASNGIVLLASSMALMPSLVDCPLLLTVLLLTALPFTILSFTAILLTALFLTALSLTVLLFTQAVVGRVVCEQRVCVRVGSALLSRNTRDDSAAPCRSTAMAYPSAPRI